LDTRTKILDWPSAEQRLRDVSVNAHGLIVVTGHFDPLLAGHVRRLREIARDGCRVLVIVTEPEDPVLHAGDRAVLVAALAGVDAVVVAPERGLEEVLAQLPGEAVVREESADRRRSAEFVADVRARLKPQVAE